MMYVPSRYFSQGIGFFISLLMKRFLGPLYAGMWDLLKVIMSYVDYSELGTTLAIYYKIPIFQGQGKTKDAEHVQSTVFTFIMLCSTAAAIGLISYGLISYKSLSVEMFWGYISIAVLVITERIHTFYIMLMRAYKDYNGLSKSTCFDAVVNLLLVIVIVGKFRFFGILLASNILTLLNILYIRRLVHYKIRFGLTVKDIIGYIKFGFPVYLTTILTVLLNTIDRLMIAGFLGLQQLGFYSIALMSKNYSYQLSTNFSHVTSPHFMEDYGKYGNDQERMKAYLLKGSFAISCFMTVILGYIYIFSVPLIHSILPAFVPGLTALKIFIFISYLSSLTTFPTNYIVTQEKQNKLVLFAALALILNVALNFYFIKSNFGINGVASATAASSLAYLAVIFIHALSHFSNLKETALSLGKLLFPCLSGAVLLLTLDRFFRYDNLWISAVFRALIYTVLVFCIAIVFEKETGLIAVTIDLIKRKLAKK